MRTRGYILDGFPRTVVQANALDEIAGDKPLDTVIDLFVAREVVIRRISAGGSAATAGPTTPPRAASASRGSARCAAAT